MLRLICFNTFSKHRTYCCWSVYPRAWKNTWDFLFRFFVCVCDFENKITNMLLACNCLIHINTSSMFFFLALTYKFFLSFRRVCCCCYYLLKWTTLNTIDDVSKKKVLKSQFEWGEKEVKKVDGWKRWKMVQEVEIVRKKCCVQMMWSSAGL